MAFRLRLSNTVTGRRRPGDSMIFRLRLSSTMVCRHCLSDMGACRQCKRNTLAGQLRYENLSSDSHICIYAPCGRHGNTVRRSRKEGQNIRDFHGGSFISDNDRYQDTADTGWHHDSHRRLQGIRSPEAVVSLPPAAEHGIPGNPAACSDDTRFRQCHMAIAAEIINMYGPDSYVEEW